MDSELIDRLLCLSALALDARQRSALGTDLQRIVDVLADVKAASSDGAAPLLHPLDGCQPLRRDATTEAVDRECCQRGAPALRDGFYLVPRVVE